MMGVGILDISALPDVGAGKAATSREWFSCLVEVQYAISVSTSMDLYLERLIECRCSPFVLEPLDPSPLGSFHDDSLSLLLPMDVRLVSLGQLTLKGPIGTLVNQIDNRLRRGSILSGLCMCD
jgi:hypothetical protein